MAHVDGSPGGDDASSRARCGGRRAVAYALRTGLCCLEIQTSFTPSLTLEKREAKRLEVAKAVFGTRGHAGNFCGDDPLNRSLDRCDWMRIESINEQLILMIRSKLKLVLIGANLQVDLSR